MMFLYQYLSSSITCSIYKSLHSQWWISLYTVNSE